MGVVPDGNDSQFVLTPHWCSKLPYTGKLLRQKNFRESVKNTIFAEKTFGDCSLSLRQRMPCPQISWRKLLQITIKP